MSFFISLFSLQDSSPAASHDVTPLALCQDSSPHRGALGA